MSISPVHHASLTVADLDRSISFYEDVLGLRTVLRSSLDAAMCEGYLKLPVGTKGRMAMLQSERQAIGALELLEFTPALPGATAPKRPGEPGVWMLAFEVVGESLHQAHARLWSRGVTFWSDITMAELAGYPPFPMVLLEDPDGTLLELIELPARDALRAARAEGDRP